MKKIGLLFLTLILLSGCSSDNHRPAPVTEPTQKANSTTQTNTITVKPKQTSIKQALLNHYQEWKGVTYKYGGLSKNGIDCSGFVYLTYKKLFGIKLPRSTKLLSSIGKRINQTQLKPGDLVLYKTSRTVRHAGIYIGDNKFLHASKSKGVMISDMNLDYWNDRFWQARRIL